MNYISQYSLVTTPIEILAENTKAIIGNASGFIVKYCDIHFLVTNWHVFSGKNYQTGELLHSSGAVPGFINFNITYRDENQIEHTYRFEEPISYFNFNVWKEHPSTEHKHDVAVFPIEYLVKNIGNTIEALNIEDTKLIETDFRVMDNIFIVGYPLKNKSTPNKYPVYKTGTIASEPNVKEFLPHILVDSKTKSGMSGSLVVIKKSVVEKKYDFNSALHFNQTKILGIYSGRESVSKDYYEAELGIIWTINNSLIPILEKMISDLKNNNVTNE